MRSKACYLMITARPEPHAAGRLTRMELPHELEAVPHFCSGGHVVAGMQSNTQLSPSVVQVLPAGQLPHTTSPPHCEFRVRGWA